jgi:hypothetical protein
MAKTRAAAIREVVMHAGWGALVVCAGVSGCSGPPALVTACIDTTVSCNGAAMPLTQIGEEVSTSSVLPETTPDGTLVNGHPINLQCTVSGSGSGPYSLTLSANDNANGTTIITGQASLQSGSTSISGTFTTTLTGTEYDGSNCTLTFTFPGKNALPAGATGIAPGLVWGHVSCPTATAVGQAQGSGAAMCDVESDFLFENCTE